MFSLGRIWDRFMTPDVEKLKKKRNVRGLLCAIWNKRVGYEAVKALRELKDPRAVEGLCKLLNHPCCDDALAHFVACALEQINDRRAVPPLIEALGRIKDGRDVIHALGALRDARAVEPLCLQLRHHDEAMRASIAKSLMELGDPRAAEPLLAAFREQAEASKSAFLMALALARLGNFEGIDLIKRELLNGDRYCAALNYAVACAEALAASGEPKWSQWLHGDPEKDLERMLTSGDPSVVEPLVANMRAKFLDMVRDDIAHSKQNCMHTTIAARQLSLSRHPLAAAAFIEALNLVRDWSCLYPEPWIRTAIETLGEMRDSRAVEAVCKFLKLESGDNTRYPIHEAVTNSLAKIGPPAVECLRQRAENPSYRKHAMEVLKRIDSP